MWSEVSEELRGRTEDPVRTVLVFTINQLTSSSQQLLFMAYVNANVNNGCLKQYK